MTDTCPSWPTLLAWLENDLPDVESQLLSTHVADCPECRDKLAVMNVVQNVGVDVDQMKSRISLRASSRKMLCPSPRGDSRACPEPS